MNKNMFLMSIIVTSLFFAGCNNDSSTKPSTEQTSEVVNNKPIILKTKTTTASQASYPTELPKGRLPESIRPTLYNLDISIDPDQAKFSGTTKMDLELDVHTQHIWLHGKDLDVTDAKIVLANGETINAKYQQMDETGGAKLTFDKVISEHKGKLVINYSAPFNEALEGLYRVKDGDYNYAFTQFEATAARLSFPSFDEPAFKVPFDVSMTVKKEHEAFANTPVVSETDLGNGNKKIVFARSKPLPTYLIAFAVGAFDVVEWKDIPANSIRKEPIPLRGIATKGKGAKLNYALENTDRILTALEDYFQIPYPYAKLDIVAVPDFNAGAMENVGLITYREQLLLFDNTISLRQKQAYMNVHAHELAHQWFGNLVTPVWWDDIWLNEAFATWMAHVSNNNIEPEQKFRQALLGRSLGAMRSDSLISARQIRQPIASNHDIQSAFDGITYSKGGGVLSMLESFLGPEEFRSGIQHYMKKFAFKNATANDFITAIGEKSTKVPVNIIRDAFNSFLEQPGIPYLNVEMSCKDNKTELAISQSRYLPIGSKGSTEQSWKVPACIGYEIDGNAKQYCQLLDKQQEVISLPETGCPSYIMPNKQGAGYYRFALSADGWKNLMSNKDKLSTEEMMSANNSFTAAINAGTLDFSALIDLAPNLIESDSARIANAPMSMLSFAYDKVAKTDKEKSALAKANRDLYGAKLNKLGLASNASDSVDTTQMRNGLIGFLATQGQDKAIRKYLTNMAQSYTGYKSDNRIHPDKADSNVIGTALSVAVDELDEPFVRHLMALFLKENDGTVRGRLLGGIGSTKNPLLAKELRDWTLSDKLRDNEIGYFIRGQLSEPTLQDAMWTWFKDNLEGVKSRIPPFGQNQLPRIGSAFCSAEKREDFTQFFEPIVEKLAGAPRPFKQAIEGIELCEAMVKHHTPSIKKYINSIK